MHLPKTLFLFCCLFALPYLGSAQSLKIVDQDYSAALQEAKAADKLVFIDFYTTWCGPCKQLDKYVFKNDSMQAILGEHVVLLKYDAENDTVFHLSKKYHVNSYPTGLLLNHDGHVLKRVEGFRGEDTPSMGKSVVKFVDQSLELNQAGEYIGGYATGIDPSVYPGFYADYINRTDTDVDSSEMNTYFLTNTDVLSEGYFAPLIYFGFEVNEAVASRVLERKADYEARYGSSNTGQLTYYLVMGKFDRATKAKSQDQFNQAASFARELYGEEKGEEMTASFRLNFLQAQGKWEEVIAIHQEAKERGERSNGYLNHISWGIYAKCDNEKVIRHCLGWMKEVVAETPEYDYLDTYAFLLYKAGEQELAREIAERAIEIGRKEEQETEELEKLLGKL